MADATELPDRPEAITAAWLTEALATSIEPDIPGDERTGR